SFEWRGKITTPGWQRAYYWGLVGGSWIPAVLWGVAFGNLVAGMKIEPLTTTVSNVDGVVTRQTLQYTGTFWDLLTNGHGFALLSGVLTAVVFLAHGAIFLALKTTGDLQARAASAASRISVAALVVGAVWAIWLQLAYSGKMWTWLPLLVAAIALAGSAWFTRVRSEGRAFACSAVAIVAAVVLIFGSLYPDVIPSNVDPAYSLTVHNASSSAYTLTMMSWVALIFTPIVLAYQAWSYWVFRKRIGVQHIPEQSPVTFADPRVNANPSR
ncbi:MAG TPA: cytochrome d ubiquinol oxidase subunit II, partial [Cellulomonas sp.]